MRYRSGLLIVAALIVARTPEATAQDSVFGIRGLGFLGRPISARSAAMGGGDALFDGNSALSPASFAAWRGLAGWAVGTGSRRTFNGGTGDLSLTSMRFPLFGFAAPIGSRLVVGITASDYLDRNWDVTRDTTVMPRDSAVAATDRTKSVGGVTDIRFAAAYRVSGAMAVGVGFHALTGAAQTSVLGQFPADSAYHPFFEASRTDYRGVGVSFGVFVTPVPRLVLGASARFNGRLEATNPSATAHVHLPTELSGGIYFQPVDGVTVASTVGHANWSVAAADLQAAGQAPSRDVWSVGLGVDVALLKFLGNLTPVRAGYRWRQLPFLVGTDALSEHALSGGITLTAAGGRANVDVAVEGGARTAGALTERFTTMLVGVSIFP